MNYDFRVRRWLRLVVRAVLGAAVAGWARVPQYELTDLTGDYAAFFDRTQDLAARARIAAFKADVGGRLPGFYDAAQMPGITPRAARR